MTGPHESADSIRAERRFCAPGGAVSDGGPERPVEGFAHLEPQGVPASEADDLVAALGARAVAGGTARGGRAARVSAGLRVRGSRFADGWDEGVTVVSWAGLASTRIRTGVSASGRTRVRCPGPLDDAWPHTAYPHSCPQRPSSCRGCSAHTPAHHGPPPGTGGAGQGRRAVYRADAKRRRGRHRLHARHRALRPGRQAVLQRRKARRVAQGRRGDLEGPWCSLHSARDRLKDIRDKY